MIYRELPTKKKKRLEENIAPIKDKIVKKSSYFDDGYQVGDVSKTILSTAGDAAANIGKGFFSTIEGVTDTAQTLLGDLSQKRLNAKASIFDLFGDDEYANTLREAGKTKKEELYKNASMDVTGALLGETNDIFKNNWSKSLNEKSVAGSLTTSVEQGIGNIGAFVGLGGLTEGAAGITFMNSFSSSYGNTLTNGLRNGLSEKEAKGQATTSGLAEAISEQFFQGIPGLKTAGWADDLISEPIEKYFKGKTGKVALKIFDSVGEGFEEIISNVLQSTFEGIRKGESVGKIFNDATSQGFFSSPETREAFISALISSALTNGGSALITNNQKNQVIDTYAKEYGLTKEETTKLFDGLVEKKANLEDTSNYKERVELEENIEKQLVKDIKTAQKNGQQVDLNELFEQTPNSKKEIQFRFNQDEANNVKSEKQNILANDMARLNDEKSNHDLYKTINAIQSANDTQQYHITTTEGLYEMGIVNKDANGNYVMPDGSPYVPRGLNYKNGEIYINADVGSQSGTQAVYHEMLEGFKKASPEQYNQFKQMVTDIIGEKNIQKEFDTYKAMYGEELTDDIRDEIINDKFGELAENQNFINKIADNRNVLEKFIDSIKNMIKYVKGTDEERQLMKLQNKLEKEFAKRYKETDFSQGEGDTAYSLNKDAIRDLAKKIDYSPSMLEANLGETEYDVKRYLTKYTGIVDQYMKDNNIKVEPVMKSTGLENYSQEYKDFIKNNDITVKKLGTNESLLNKYFDVLRQEMLTRGTPENIVNGIIQSERESFELVDENYDIPFSLKRSENEFDLIRNDTSEITDEWETEKKIQKEVIDSPKFQKYLDNLISPLFHKESHTVDEVMEEAIYNHGTTDDYSTGAYMTTDGQLLDFDDGGYRDDHRTISVFDLDMKEFMDYGAIRMKPEGNGFEIAVEPTDAQYDRLEDYIDNYLKTNAGVHSDNTSIYVDIDRQGGTTYDTQTYSINTPTSKIINDIQTYFRTGTYPKQSELAQFRYSLTSNKDSQGRELSPQQQEYFKDSKVVDDNGNLLEVYHGQNSEHYTYRNPGNKFNNDFASNKMFEGTEITMFTSSEEIANSYIDNEDNPDMKPVKAYLNITNPYVVDAKNQSNKYFLDNDGTPTNVNNLVKRIYDSGEYDGVIIKNVADIGEYYEYDITDGRQYATDYIVFNSNQIKNVDNTNPTSNEDIRYSLTTNKDSTGRELSPKQQEFFKDSKVVDKDGNLLLMHNGRYSNDTVFKPSRWTNEKNGPTQIKGYFASDSEYSEIYGDVSDYYLNIKNPLYMGVDGQEAFTLDEWQQFFKEHGVTGVEFDSSLYGPNTKGNLPAKNGKPRYLAFEIVDSDEYWNNDGNVTERIKAAGYDGLTWTEGGISYMPFESNQIKNVDNLNPTENDDIRLSLTSNENIDSKEIAPVGSTVEETIAPIREDISNLTDKIDNLSTQLETMQNGAEMPARNDIAPSRALNNTEIAPEEAYKDENYWKSLEEFAETNTGELDKKVAKKLSKNMAKQLGLKQKQLGDLQTIIEDAFNKGKSVQEIKNDLDLQFGHDSVVEKNNEAIEAQKLIRQFPINVSPNIQKNIADYGYWKQFYFGKIKFSKDGDSVDSVYQQLNALNPAMFPGDIWNETDQLLKIAEVADMDRKYTVDYELPQQTIDEAANYIHDTFMETMYANAIKSANDLEESALQYNEYLKEIPVEKKTRQQVREFLQKGMGITTDDLQEGNDISSMSYNLTTPERVNEKVFGREIGRKINNETVFFAKHQEAERTRFLNKERQEIKDLGIKARSKESELVQKYGEGLIDDIELANEIQDKATQDKIKNAAKVLRSKYDTYLDMINVELVDMGYDPIPKRKDYMRHFQELTDKFSMAGIPFNRQDMNAENLPTDINGLTEFNAPGKNWFASALKRKGEKTTYDAITGIDGYLEGASNLMYHTETIQRYRALEKLIRDTYGQTHGLEEFGDDLSTEDAMQRLQDIEEGKLSNYAAWIHEQANAIAGKKGALDRGVERFLGRKAYTLANTLKKQTGSNMTGFNVRSAMTNFISSTIAASKTNKLAMVKGTVDTIKNIFNDDGFINRSDFLTSRFGSDSISKKTWDKISNAGQIFMTGSDWFTSNLIVRSKYYEGLQNGMTEEEAMNYANDFGARVMGDRSKGATAEAFNSKTLGILTQFQLETNNQWQYMIHDTKMEYQKNVAEKGGLKAGATVLFQMGQLAAYSYLFNEMFEKLTGSRAAFDIADIIKKLFGLDDDDKDKTFEERMKEAGSELVDALPFASLFGSGGRLPIGEMLTPAQTVYDYITGGTNKYGQEITLKDVGKDLRETLPYYVLPTGYGQLKKTKQGLEMYSDELPVAGSYTDSGNLRFTADEDTGSMIKNALFGKWADTEARKYRESGYKTIRKEDIQEMKDLGMKSSEYRDYKTGLKEAGTKNADKIDYINSLDIPINQKNIMAENVLDKDIDMSDYNKYGSYAEFDYAYKNPEQYLTISQITDYDTYNQYKNDIQQIRSSYSTTNERKAAVQQYIEGLDLNKYQKIMLQKMAGGYSIKSYKSSLQRYIDSLDLTASEKQQIDNMLFK